jgi:hypothetical protein
VKARDVKPFIEALETDNPSALRQIGREQRLDLEALLVRIFEAAGVVYATKKEPTRSKFFEALLVIGQELDSEAIAWAIIERKRRTDTAAAAATNRNPFR